MVSLELARVAERAERYDDMADYMQARVMEGQPLDTEERDMFPSCGQCLIAVRHVPNWQGWLRKSTTNPRSEHM